MTSERFRQLIDQAYVQGRSQGEGDAQAECTQESPLSGEWADGLLCQDVISSLLGEGEELRPEEETELLDSWEDGYHSA